VLLRLTGFHGGNDWGLNDRGGAPGDAILVEEEERVMNKMKTKP
jgi:hypothetical protein